MDATPSGALLRASAAVDWLAASYEGAARPALDPHADLLAATPGWVAARALAAFEGVEAGDLADLLMALVAASAAPASGAGVAIALAVGARAEGAAGALGRAAAARGVSGPASLLTPAVAPTLAWALSLPARPANEAGSSTHGVRAATGRAAAVRGAVAAFLPGLAGCGLGVPGAPAAPPGRLSPAAADAGLACLERLLREPMEGCAGAPHVPATAAGAVARACLAPGVPSAGGEGTCRRASPHASTPSPTTPPPFAHPSVRARLLALRPTLRALGVAGLAPSAWVPPALARAAASADLVVPGADGRGHHPLAVAAAEDALHAAAAEPEVAVAAMRSMAEDGATALPLARLLAALATAQAVPFDARAAPAAAAALARLGKDLASGGPPSTRRSKAASAALAAAGAALAARAQGKTAEAAGAVLAGAAAEPGAAAGPSPSAPASTSSKAAAGPSRSAPRLVSTKPSSTKARHPPSPLVAVVWALLLVATLAARTGAGGRAWAEVKAALAIIFTAFADAARRFLVALATPSAEGAAKAEADRLRALRAAGVLA